MEKLSLGRDDSVAFAGIAKLCCSGSSKAGAICPSRTQAKGDDAKDDDLVISRLTALRPSSTLSVCS